MITKYPIIGVNQDKYTITITKEHSSDADYYYSEWYELKLYLDNSTQEKDLVHSKSFDIVKYKDKYQEMTTKTVKEYEKKINNNFYIKEFEEWDGKIYG